MDSQRIHEMGQASKTMDNAEFQLKFRMSKDEFLRQYEFVTVGSGDTAAGTWSKRKDGDPNKYRPVSSARPEVQKAQQNPNANAGGDQSTSKQPKMVLNRNGNIADSAYQNRTRKREKSIQKMGRRGTIGTFGFLGAVLDGYSTYGAAREEDPNGSKLGDFAKASAVAAGWLYTPGLMWSIAGAKGAIALGTEVYEDANRNYQAEKRQALHITQDASGTAKGTLGGQLIDSETAYTMRQRSEQVMRQHRIATETILGSEARQLHR